MKETNTSSKVLLPSYQIQRRLPANYKKGDLDFCKQEFSYATNDVEQIEFKNAIVNKKGFLFKNNFSIVEDSLVYIPDYIHLFTFKYHFKKVFLKPKTRLNEDCLLCFDDWGHNHYHWFCDTLPRIFALRDKLPYYTLLLPDDAYVKSIGLKTLKLLDLMPKQIRFIKEKELIKAKTVTLITKVTVSGYINDVIMYGVGTKFREVIKKSSLKERKLYVSRDHARYRKVVNEGEVMKVMESFGYEIVFYDNLSLREQIELTLNCISMVSIHGAGLTNMIYMPEGAAVLEFRRDKVYRNQCYWHLADALKLKFYYLFGTPDREELVIEGGDSCNLTIDLAALTATLQQIEEALESR